VLLSESLWEPELEEPLSDPRLEAERRSLSLLPLLLLLLPPRERPCRPLALHTGHGAIKQRGSDHGSSAGLCYSPYKYT
jgi:hypothetical protein